MNASVGTGCFFHRPIAAGELTTPLLCVFAGFRRLLSLQASRGGEEGFVEPQGDTRPTTKRTAGKTVIPHVARCDAMHWQQKARDRLDYTQRVHKGSEKDASFNDGSSKWCIFCSPHRFFHLCLNPI